MTTKARLECGVRILESIASRRRSSGDPTLFSSVEREIVARELAELEAEWIGGLKIDALLRGPKTSTGEK